MYLVCTVPYVGTWAGTGDRYAVLRSRSLQEPPFFGSGAVVAAPKELVRLLPLVNEYGSVPSTRSYKLQLLYNTILEIFDVFNV